jgi:putative methyltransferase (TIGR04325 family)
MTLKSALRLVLPPVLVKAWRAVFPRPTPLRKAYRTWAEAKACAGSYGAPNILASVLQGALAVKSGQAAFERDSVTFPRPELNAPLVAALGYVASATRGNLRVLDFGGSLGSSYWQSRPFLSPAVNLAWDVVEQPHFVAAGREHFADTPLRFFGTIQEAQAATEHDVLLASGVIQYLENPDWLFDRAKASSCPYFILTRMPLQETGRDYAAIEHVPPSIYQATYPVWFFDRDTLWRRLRSDYEMVFDVALQQNNNGVDPPGHVLWLLRRRR